MMRSRFTALLVLAVLLAGCAPLAALGSTTKGAASELTIVYTGHARGNVDPQPECE